MKRRCGMEKKEERRETDKGQEGQRKRRRKEDRKRKEKTTESRKKQNGRSDRMKKTRQVDMRGEDTRVKKDRR